MPIADSYALKQVTDQQIGLNAAGSGGSWSRPSLTARPQAKAARTEAALCLVRHDLESRIAFLEKVCAEADDHRNASIAARYARALRDAQEELILLSLGR